MTSAPRCGCSALLAVPAVLAAYLASRRRAKRYAVRFTAMPSLQTRRGHGARLAAPPARRAGARGARRARGLAGQAAEDRGRRRAARLDHARHRPLGLDEGHRRQPNRLAAAQRAARNFLNRLPGGIRVGVVAFSDTPDAVQAPSADHDAARRIIDDEIADGATDTGDALQVAIDALQHDRQNGKRPPSAIVLISDGKTTTGSDPVTVANLAGKLRIPIHTVALGSLDTTIPNPNPFGPPIPVPPDPETLGGSPRRPAGAPSPPKTPTGSTRSTGRWARNWASRSSPRRSPPASRSARSRCCSAAGAASLRWAGRLP